MRVFCSGRVDKKVRNPCQGLLGRISCTLKLDSMEHENFRYRECLPAPVFEPQSEKFRFLYDQSRWLHRHRCYIKRTNRYAEYILKHERLFYI